MVPKNRELLELGLALLLLVALPFIIHTGEKIKSTKLTQKDEGLHGYISFDHGPIPPEYGAGIGFYVAVWPLIDEPLAGFQIGLPSTWILPDNSDNKNTPLCPERTLARKWKLRGPTWSSVFQTIEGGVGYWAGNHFRYGPPKFSMNGTPQCYDYEVGSPGWSFFYSDQALPDDRLGLAQLSNRLLIPPDGITFEGNPDGEFFGYAWMALPWTDPEAGDLPTGDQGWTCFLSAANFKGPIAFFIPETWSKIGKLFNYPFLYGRGLDARPGIAGGGAIEINTVPRFEVKDSNGQIFAKLPRLQFSIDEQGRSILVQEVTYYSKAALYDSFKRWRDKGVFCSGRFDENGARQPKLSARMTRYDMAGKEILGVEGEAGVLDTKVFEGNMWGLQWKSNVEGKKGIFPQYYVYSQGKYSVMPGSKVPSETGLLQQRFKLAESGAPYISPSKGAWTNPGPKAGPYRVNLSDGSVVTYYWYRFIDQPAFQQYRWPAEKKARLQAMAEKIHACWPINRDYMAPQAFGQLVKIDRALIVTPPPGMELGYVPIVVRQEARRK